MYFIIQRNIDAIVYLLLPVLGMSNLPCANNSEKEYEQFSQRMEFSQK